MLTRRFYDIWFLGRLDGVGVKKLKECVFEAMRRGEERVRIRFYLRNGADISYLDELKKVLLENVLLSVVVESRELEKLTEDLESDEGEVTLIINESSSLPDLTRFQKKLRIVGGDKYGRQTL